MSKLTEYAKKNPGIAALLRQLIYAVIFGVSPAQRDEFRAAMAELDSDGDGVPDSEDAAPNDAAVTTRKPRAKKSA